MKTTLMAAVAAIATAGGGGAAFAQAGDWSGFYVGVALGYADRSESDGERVSFDTDLNGSYGDTVRTAAGADAFSPGFCPGSFNTNAAAGGCRNDDKSDAEISIRAGYDFQFG